MTYMTYSVVVQASKGAWTYRQTTSPPFQLATQDNSSSSGQAADGACGLAGFFFISSPFFSPQMHFSTWFMTPFISQGDFCRAAVSLTFWVFALSCKWRWWSEIHIHWNAGDYSLICTRGTSNVPRCDLWFSFVAKLSEKVSIFLLELENRIVKPTAVFHIVIRAVSIFKSEYVKLRQTCRFLFAFGAC